MITVAGLGPGDLDRVPRPVLSLLLDTGRTVIARTIHHPGAEQLASQREVIFCDDLYERSDTFEDVYSAIADRVVEASEHGPVVYAVPGSPLLGEFAVRELLDRNADVELIEAESFVDAVLREVGYDPLDRGLQILDGHDLPDPFVLDKPTIVGQLDRPEVLADVCTSLGRVVSDESVVTLLVGLGAADSTVLVARPDDIDSDMAGYRTSLFIDVEPGGLIGAVHTMRVLREQCPWDREQTHQSLVKNLVEESYELIEAINRLGDSAGGTEHGPGHDWVRYAEVEDELGDVLLQVLFHSVIARQAGAFDIDDAAEVMRRKLIRRHPHVFGGVEVESAEEVKANWDRIKEDERGDSDLESALDGVPRGMPGLHRAAKIQNRAAKVGFDWVDVSHVLRKVEEEMHELAGAMAGEGDIRAELGDLLFSAVNLARHLGLDAELALGAATARFERRFRKMEEEGPLDGLDLDGLNARWDRIKAED